MRLSALTEKSQDALMKKMTVDDLKYMAGLGKEVRDGVTSLAQYRLQERSMLVHYGFQIRDNKVQYGR
jgi:phage replication-related protein YjqB (UPF0714/DUF867 family)